MAGLPLENLAHAWRFKLGIVLVVFSLLAFGGMPLGFALNPLLHYPCEAIFNFNWVTDRATRIRYCFGYETHTFSGSGGIYAMGNANQDRVALEEPVDHDWYGRVILERQGTRLMVNRQAQLDPYEMYSWRRNTWSINPWLLSSTTFWIIHRGFVGSGATPEEKALSAGGSVLEGWLPGPVGPLILLLGWGILLEELCRRFQVIKITHRLPVFLLAVGVGLLQSGGALALGLVCQRLRLYYFLMVSPRNSTVLILAGLTAFGMLALYTGLFGAQRFLRPRSGWLLDWAVKAASLLFALGAVKVVF